MRSNPSKNPSDPPQFVDAHAPMVPDARFGRSSVVNARLLRARQFAFAGAYVVIHRKSAFTKQDSVRTPSRAEQQRAMTTVSVAQRIVDSGMFRLARESVTIMIRNKKRWDSGEKRDFQYRYRLWQRGTEGKPDHYVGEYEMSDAIMREEMGVLDAWARAGFRDGVFDVHQLAQAVSRRGVLLVSEQPGEFDEDDLSDSESNSVYDIQPDRSRVVNRVYAVRDHNIGLEVVFDLSAAEARAEVIGSARDEAEPARSSADKTMDVPMAGKTHEE
jgi:hypothetical protein